MYPEHFGCRLILAKGFRVQCSFQLPSTAPLVFSLLECQCLGERHAWRLRRVRESMSSPGYSTVHLT
jgi:hypothetical protein